METQGRIKLRKNDTVKVIAGPGQGQDGTRRAHRPGEDARGGGRPQHGEEGHEAEEAEPEGRHHLRGSAPVRRQAHDHVQEVRPDPDRVPRRRRTARSGCAASAEGICEQGKAGRRRRRGTPQAPRRTPKALADAKAREGRRQGGEGREARRREKQPPKREAAAEGRASSGQGRARARRGRRAAGAEQARSPRPRSRSSGSPRLQAPPEGAVPGDGGEGPEGRVQLQEPRCRSRGSRRSS